MARKKRSREQLRAIFASIRAKGREFLKKNKTPEERGMEELLLVKSRFNPNIRLTKKQLIEKAIDSERQFKHDQEVKAELRQKYLKVDRVLQSLGILPVGVGLVDKDIDDTKFMSDIKKYAIDNTIREINKETSPHIKEAADLVLGTHPTERLQYVEYLKQTGKLPPDMANMLIKLYEVKLNRLAGHGKLKKIKNKNIENYSSEESFGRYIKPKRGAE